MHNKITKIINEWDPVGIIEISPKDEYAPEIKEIVKVIKENPEISAEELSKEISNIFVKMFDEDLFEDTDGFEVFMIATEIIKAISK